MTTLIAWIGVDHRTPASLYLASDSRISWGDGRGMQVWDRGRKLFASRVRPDVLGYCGDVLFPSLVIGQIVDSIDAGVFFRAGEGPLDRGARIQSTLAESLAAYPMTMRNAFTVIYGSRDGEGMDAALFLMRIDWSPNTGWSSRKVELPEKSGIVASLGSGEARVEEWKLRWDRTKEGRTSRAVFSAFCDAVHEAGDPKSGGGPQLVGLYLRWPAKYFGVIYKDQRYLAGLPVAPDRDTTAIEWRNSLFERCDGKTKNRMRGAKAQSAPKGLGRGMGH